MSIPIFILNDTFLDLGGQRNTWNKQNMGRADKGTRLRTSPGGSCVSSAASSSQVFGPLAMLSGALYLCKPGHYIFVNQGTTPVQTLLFNLSRQRLVLSNPGLPLPPKPFGLHSRSTVWRFGGNPVRVISTLLLHFTWRLVVHTGDPKCGQDSWSGEALKVLRDWQRAGNALSYFWFSEILSHFPLSQEELVRVGNISTMVCSHKVLSAQVLWTEAQTLVTFEYQLCFRASCK